jgi:general secretion pathway protein C
VQVDLQRLLNYLLLGLSVVGGVVTGIAIGRLIDLGLGQTSFSQPASLSRQVELRQLKEDDFQIILKRNLFDSKAAGGTDRVDLSTTAITDKAVPKAKTSAGNLSLIGTVVAGQESLALIKVGQKVRVFRLDEKVSSGVTVADIGRKQVVLDDHGSRRTLALKKQKKSAVSSRQRSNQSVPKKGVVAVEEGHWQVSRSVADNARANLTSLLQTARMVPQVKNGQTIGFKLLEMEKGSLLEQIGLKVGDLIVEINQVKLNSPEKALQIFQQVREANNITLGLIRNGQSKTFEYSFE